MTRRWLPAAVAAVTALGGACSDTTTFGVIQLNLDRPVDVSFACYGKMRRTDGRPGMGVASDTVITTAMPLSICQALSPPLSTDTITPVPGQEQITNADNPSPVWYGFFLQSASGTVALAQWKAVPADAMFPSGQGTQQFSDTGLSLFRVLDADPLTPGKNALSIGEDPVALGTDKTGCFEITANAGSCDLSELDITTALSNIVDGNPVRPRVDRVSVVVQDGTMDGKPHFKRILSKPSAMIVEPFRDDRDSTGNACPVTPDSKLYIAYPSCHLVAEVKLGPDKDGNATATVIGGIQFNNGTASVLTGPDDLAKLSCPTECAPDPTAPVVNATDGARPVALDYRLDPRKTAGSKSEITSKLAIGVDIRSMPPLAAPVTVVNLDLTTFDPVPDSLVPIALEGNVGVSALALSPQIGMGGDLSANPTGSVSDETNFQAQYVYAIATDGTVRVAEVLTRKRECDTQIDARFLRNVTLLPALPVPQDPSLDCLPFGRPDLPRRPGARSPGIELPGGAIANSVAIIKGLTAAPRYTPPPSSTTPNPVPTPMPAQPGLFVGHFAVITASTGAVFVANVDDDYVPDSVNPIAGKAVASSPVLVMAHQLRDGLSDRENPPKDCTSVDGPGGVGTGGPRLGASPGQQFTTGTLFDDLDNQLPRLQQVACDIEHAADPEHKPLVPVTALEFGAPEVQTDLTAGPATARDTVYPDLRTVSVSVRPSSSQSLENWTLTYEGTLELDSTLPSTNGPSLHFGQTFVDRTGMFIEDASQPFCHMGVEPGDVVEFRGCDPAHLDADCPAGYTCYVHPASTLTTGACFRKTEAVRLQDACRDFLTSVRRYTVGTDASGGTAPGKLVLWQRKHELSTTPVDGCVSDAQCDDLARAARVINQSADPFLDPVKDQDKDQAQTRWSCQADPLRKPLNGDPSLKRCVQTCTYTPGTAQNPNPKPAAPLCGNGTVCVPITPPPPTPPDSPPPGVPGVCMEGVEPPQVCLNGPQRYVVRAGEAFAVIGDQTGFVHPIVTSADGRRCVRDPNLDKDPLSIGRIPLTAPACGPVPTDPALARDYPFTGRIDSSRFEANPCSLTVQQFEFTLDYVTCADGNPAVCAGGQPPPCDNGQAPLCRDGQPPGTCRTPSKPLQAAKRDVPAIKFRNRALTLTVVDPYRSSGDARFCIGRNPGNVVTNVPMVVPGYQISFAVKAGFSPVTLGFNAPQISPVKVVRGPTESIWVVDDGDFIGNGITDVTTRGRVFRVESVPAPPGTGPGAEIIVNTMQ